MLIKLNRTNSADPQRITAIKSNPNQNRLEVHLVDKRTIYLVPGEKNLDEMQDELLESLEQHIPAVLINETLIVNAALIDSFHCSSHNGSVLLFFSNGKQWQYSMDEGTDPGLYLDDLQQILNNALTAERKVSKPAHNIADGYKAPG